MTLTGTQLNPSNVWHYDLMSYLMNMHIQPTADTLAKQIAEHVVALLRERTAIAPAYLTPEQAAEYTSVPVRTLAGWRSKKKFAGPPFVREGKLVRYAVKELDKWMKARTVRPE